jgi:peptidoglycan/xylan/chitin deacetylase (PgdA/CDA1 family)
MKHALAAPLAAVGLLGLAERALRGRGPLVFNFHRVLPEAELSDCYNPYLAVTDTSFTAFLRFIRNRMRIVPLTELLDQTHSKERTCSITFDDGWEDNLRIALPIAKAFQVPITIFLPTGLIGTAGALPEERFWWLLRDTPHALWYEPLERRFRAAGYHIPELSGATLSLLHGRFKRLPFRVKLEFLADVETAGLAFSRNRRFLDWNEVRSMRDQGVSFGSHTSRHVTLSAEDETTIGEELVQSKRDLERELGVTVQFLAYPNGSYNAAVLRLARESGYSAAFTTRDGPITSRSDRYMLPRNTAGNDTLNDPSGKFSPSFAQLLLVRAYLGRGKDIEY